MKNPRDGMEVGLLKILGDGRELVGGRHVAHKPAN
jgi:hypothetical protein